MTNSAFTVTGTSPGSGSWTKLQTNVITPGTSNVAFTNLNNTYSLYVIVASNILATSASTTNLFLRTSSNNGVSYDNGAGNYAWQESWAVSNSGTGTTDNVSDTSITFNTITVYTIYNVPGYTQQGLIYIFNPSASNFCCIRSDWGGWFFFGGGGGGLFQGTITGNSSRVANAAVNAVQFTTTAGTLASGSMSLYGIV